MKPPDPFQTIVPWKTYSPENLNPVSDQSIRRQHTSSHPSTALWRISAPPSTSVYLSTAVKLWTFHRLPEPISRMSATSSCCTSRLPTTIESMYRGRERPSAGDILPGTLWPVFPAAVRRVHNLFARNERAIVDIETDAGLLQVVFVGAFGVGRITLTVCDLTTNAEALRVTGSSNIQIHFNAENNLASFI